MLRVRKVFLLLSSLLVMMGLAGCANQNAGSPAAEAIDAYLDALVQKEENQMINLACAEWESQAKLEFDSFAAVKVTLEGPGCTEAMQDGSIILVTCSGKIIASYGEEDLIIELKDRKYQVVIEDGEWRMCGYR